jgi:hypothetical protein
VRELREIAGYTSGGSEGGVMSVISGDSDIVSTSSSEISLEMAIKIFCSLHL